MTSLYIHIPFCKRKCNYCDFVSYAGKEQLLDEYVEALINELRSLPPTPFSPSPLIRGKGIGDGGNSRTIYFGGGTPTLLNLKHYEKVLSLLKMNFIFNNDAEITTEANPKTADIKKLKQLRSLGVNRLSIGAQSFNDQHLKTLGRIHNSEDIIRFYEDARSAGFDNINLDLIFALPNQTLAEWKKDLKTALSLQPEHLSTYNLQIEENTPLREMTKSQILKPKSRFAGSRETLLSNNKEAGQIQNSKFQIPNEDVELAMYQYAIETLTNAGYIHYEISNFAKPGLSCRHNINYWENGNYIGIGAGAHSHINGQRWANPYSVEEYIGCGCVNRNVLRQTSNDSIDATDQRETLFMGLRLLKGLPAEKFQGFELEVKELTESGLLTRDSSHIKLTRQGLYLANEVFEKFV